LVHQGFTVGATGSQGTIGTTGSQGAIGAQGVTGSTGSQGAIGSNGAQGSIGSQGAIGATGNQGTTGGVGAQGSIGSQGSTGGTGGAGSQGIQGITGGTGGAGSQGSTGLQGIQGVQGLRGIQGVQGAIGFQGVTGLQGVQGILGTGIQGIQGTAGGGGGSLVIKDEGTTIVSSTTAINFLGSCITATDAGGGQANVTVECGCEYDYMLIASNSGYNDPVSSGSYDLFFSNDMGGWNTAPWTSIEPGPFITRIKGDQNNAGVPLPIDLFPNDIITLCGTAYKVYNGGDVVSPPTLTTGLSYFNCSDLDTAQGSIDQNTIFASEGFEEIGKGYYCFSTTHVLSQTLPACDTLLLVALGLDNTNDSADWVLKFSYTLSVQRNCATVNTAPNMILRLCCELSVQEIVYNPSLTVGEYFVDNEGNCWQAYSNTYLPITGSRPVTTSYASCAACLAENECPENLIAEACCGQPQQVYTGALAGVGVGDTFVDTYGFCWEVTGTTPAPITSLIYLGGAYTSSTCADATCTNANTCPEVVRIYSCCEKLTLVTTLSLLGGGVAIGDTFLDTFGYCWEVQDEADTSFVNGAFIQVASISTGDCDTCITDDPCPTTDLYYALQKCCTGEIEIALLPFGYNVGQTLLLSTSLEPGQEVCWSVISWSLTGPTTMTITNLFGSYKDCKQCLGDYPCQTQLFEVSDCCSSLPNQTVYAPNYLGSGSVIVDTQDRCWTIVSTVSGSATIIYAFDYPEGCGPCIAQFPCQA
jgi:hypothetical protein